jgi:hypothetical protein
LGCGRLGPLRWIGLSGALGLVGLMSAGASGCYDFSSVGPRNGGVDAGSNSGTDANVGMDDTGAPASDSSSDSSGGNGCNATFCDNFDEYEGGTTIGNWDQTIQPNGAVGLTSINAFSMPYSMSAQTNIAAIGVNTEADVLKAFSEFKDTNVHIVATFEMNIQVWDPATTGQIVAFEVIFKVNSAQYNQIVINLNSLGAGEVSAQVAEAATGADGGATGYNSYPFKSHPATKTWIKVGVDLSIPNASGSQSNTVSVTVDGVTQIDAQLTLPIQQGETPYVHLGIGYVNTITTAAGAWSMLYDDFVVNFSKF